MNANEKQIGGDHYKAGIQHWDWVTVTKLPYLPATATKYLTRWKKKNGVEDIEKALHYIDKFIEEELTVRIDRRAATDDFIKQNNVEGLEATVMRYLLDYHLGDHTLLLEARNMVYNLREELANTNKKPSA